MGTCRDSLKLFLLASCVATLILGQASAFPSVRISYDAKQSIFYYDVPPALAFCVPNSFEHKMQGGSVSNDGAILRIPMLRPARPAFKPAAAFALPSMRQFWRGTPSPRSPPLCV